MASRHPRRPDSRQMWDRSDRRDRDYDRERDRNRDSGRKDDHRDRRRRSPPRSRSRCRDEVDRHHDRRRADYLPRDGPRDRSKDDDRRRDGNRRGNRDRDRERDRDNTDNQKEDRKNPPGGDHGHARSSRSASPKPDHPSPFRERNQYRRSPSPVLANQVDREPPIAEQRQLPTRHRSQDDPEEKSPREDRPERVDRANQVQQPPQQGFGFSFRMDKRAKKATDEGKRGGDEDHDMDPGNNGPRRGRQRNRRDRHEDSDDEPVVVEEDGDVAAMLGFGGFGSTKNQKVFGTNGGSVGKVQETKYRQYMNRKGGFNRPLSPPR